MKRLLFLACAVCVPAIAAPPFEIDVQFLEGVNADDVLASRAYTDVAAFTDPVLGDVDIACAGAGWEPPDIRCIGEASRVDLDVYDAGVIGYNPHTGDATFLLAVTADHEHGTISIEPNPSP